MSRLFRAMNIRRDLGVLGMADDIKKAAERRFQDRPAAFLRGYLQAQEAWLESARVAEAESLRIFGPDFMG